MSNIDDWAWKVIRACGLSTANADINVFALHKDIEEMLKPRELTDEEIGQFKGQWYRGDFNSFYDLVQAILKKTSEK